MGQRIRVHQQRELHLYPISVSIQDSLYSELELISNESAD